MCAASSSRSRGGAGAGSMCSTAVGGSQDWTRRTSSTSARRCRAPRAVPTTTSARSVGGAGPSPARCRPTRPPRTSRGR
eukprot:10473192-Alexandrium_andersonii.AAC.1